LNVTKFPRIHLITPSLVPYDAIGNDVVQMREVLSRSGYPVDVWAESIHPDRKNVARPLSTAPAEFWRSPEDILIYHHSMGWPPGENILFETRNKIILKYHNITPPRFFAPYSPPHMHACEAGVQSTKRIARLRGMTILGDSTFNCADLIAEGANPQECSVLAPFHLTEELSRGPFDLPTVQRYGGDIVNILFVGGIKPNKGHARAIRVFAEYYRCFNHRSRLIFAGGIDERLQNYIGDLRDLAARLDVGDSVLFTGSITGAQLKSLYIAADVFLCTSEHEGFCVPLVEAMCFRVPIVAWGGTAVPETVGDCGFVLEDWDEFHFASHIDLLVEDNAMAARFGELGRERYTTQFHPDVLRRQLCELAAGVARQPRTHVDMERIFG
jgi:glycosyltransferase involved in cell wall biosynthesis